MLKTISDELSPPEVKKAISNLSRELAKLRAIVRELSETAGMYCIYPLTNRGV